MAYKIFLKEVQDRASLKILKILKDLKAAITEKLTDPDIKDSRMISTKDKITIAPSKIFIVSLKYSLNPNPINLIAISVEKKIVNPKLAFSREFDSDSLNGYLLIT